MDIEWDDRRPMPRVRVQFRVTFSTSTKLGTGHMLDLSVGGCRIESPVTIEPGSSLELRICAAHMAWPVVIEAASVQWVNGQTFGLAFSQMTITEQHRLGQTVSELIGDGPSAG